jgi:multiple sugar transport system substrate-binding protein
VAPVRLRAIGWDHDRCMRPMRACTDAYRRVAPEVEITWDARSLTAFGDQPVEELAGGYDLLVVDHPFCGTAEKTGCLVPLDELLVPETLAALAADAIGPSHVSYAYGGRQWGLATDAACQVSAVRDDLLGDRPVPATWDDVLALARDLPGRTGLPLSPPHAISSFLTLCVNAGSPPAASPERLVEPAAGKAALEKLGELTRLGHPEVLAWEPPDALWRMTSSDELVYMPLVYGYSGYGVAGLVPRPCRFLDIPGGATGSTLGGAGLAVSSTSGEPEAAAAFTAWASGAEAQRTIVARNGGQPGSRSAWDDPELDRGAGGFYSGTRATIERAWIRPRDAWWPGFQLEGGEELRRCLAEGERAGATLLRLEDVYRRHRR